MHFSKMLEEEEEYTVIECTELDNNLLLLKQKLDPKEYYVIKLKENQCVILFEKGQIWDMMKEEGVYSIKKEPNNSFPEELNDYQIKKNTDELCIIFFNMNVITNNKFYIPKNHKNDFYGEGSFDFQIENSLKLFNKVIEVRSFYSREELLEQIRERLSKAATAFLKEHEQEEISKEEMMNSIINLFKEYGIKIVATDIAQIQFKKKSEKS